MTVILWLRRDLRVRDNAALRAALDQHAPIIPAVVLPPVPDGPWVRPRHDAFLGAVSGLAFELAQRGSRLVTLSGSPVNALVRLAEHTRADTLFFSRSHDPFDLGEELAVVGEMMALGLYVRGFDQGHLVAPGEIRNPQSRPYERFREYHLAWQSMAGHKPVRAPGLLPGREEVDPAAEALGGALSTPETTAATVDGEPRAHGLWLKFLNQRLYTYLNRQETVGQSFSSGVSPYLNLGCLSPAALFSTLRARRDAGLTGLYRRCVDEVEQGLCLRDFCLDRLAGDRELRRILTDTMAAGSPAAFLNGKAEMARFSAWVHGLCGVPLVDAAMTDLKTRGWISQPLRQVTAHFMIHFLKLPWQAGFLHFARSLADHLGPVNFLNWYSLSGASTGLPRPPAFSLHPVAAARSLDSEARYIRHLLPALANLTPAMAIAPFRADRRRLLSRGFILGRNYPRPIVPLE